MASTKRCKSTDSLDLACGVITSRATFTVSTHAVGDATCLARGCHSCCSNTIIFLFNHLMLVCYGCVLVMRYATPPTCSLFWCLFFILFICASVARAACNTTKAFKAFDTCMQMRRCGHPARSRVWCATTMSSSSRGAAWSAISSKERKRSWTAYHQLVLIAACSMMTASRRNCCMMCFDYDRSMCVQSLVSCCYWGLILTGRFCSSSL